MTRNNMDGKDRERLEILEMRQTDTVLVFKIGSFN